MTRVKVNNCAIMVGKEPPSAHHFDLVRFHLKLKLRAWPRLTDRDFGKNATGNAEERKKTPRLL
jgi:hypothetical protein